MKNISELIDELHSFLPWLQSLPDCGPADLDLSDNLEEVRRLMLASCREIEAMLSPEGRRP